MTKNAIDLIRRKKMKIKLKLTCKSCFYLMSQRRVRKKIRERKRVRERERNRERSQN